MAGQEEQSSIMQWALSLFDGDPAHNHVQYGDVIQHDANDDAYRGHYIRDQRDADQSNHEENDEIIAYTLQEEYSRLSVAEASDGYSHQHEDQLQPSTHHADNFHGRLYRSGRKYCSDGDYPNEEACAVVPSSSCSSSGQVTVLDNEAGWSFNELMHVPHVPKINGEIPSTDEATSDHQRLLDRLQLYGVVEHKVEGDGNCQFRALSDQLYHSQDYHNYVRREVVNQLKCHPETYRGYVPMKYNDYLKKMSKSGEWGDHVTLQAAADSYGMKILVLTSYKDTCCIEILPKVQKSKRVIKLSFWAEVHYNSIHPQEGTPSSDEYRKKKKWWKFGTKN